MPFSSPRSVSFCVFVKMHSVSPSICHQFANDLGVRELCVERAWHAKRSGHSLEGEVPERVTYLTSASGPSCATSWAAGRAPSSSIPFLIAPVHAFLSVARRAALAALVFAITCSVCLCVSLCVFACVRRVCARACVCTCVCVCLRGVCTCAHVRVKCVFPHSRHCSTSEDVSAYHVSSLSSGVFGSPVSQSVALVLL